MIRLHSLQESFLDHIDGRKAQEATDDLHNAASKKSVDMTAQRPFTPYGAPPRLNSPAKATRIKPLSERRPLSQLRTPSPNTAWKNRISNTPSKLPKRPTSMPALQNSPTKSRPNTVAGDKTLEERDHDEQRAALRTRSDEQWFFKTQPRPDTVNSRVTSGMSVDGTDDEIRERLDKDVRKKGREDTRIRFRSFATYSEMAMSKVLMEKEQPGEPDFKAARYSMDLLTELATMVSPYQKTLKMVIDELGLSLFSPYYTSKPRPAHLEPEKEELAAPEMVQMPWFEVADSLQKDHDEIQAKCEEVSGELQVLHEEHKKINDEYRAQSNDWRQKEKIFVEKVEQLQHQVKFYSETEAELRAKIRSMIIEQTSEKTDRFAVDEQDANRRTMEEHTKDEIMSLQDELNRERVARRNAEKRADMLEVLNQKYTEQLNRSVSQEVYEKVNETTNKLKRVLKTKQRLGEQTALLVNRLKEEKEGFRQRLEEMENIHDNTPRPYWPAAATFLRAENMVGVREGAVPSSKMVKRLYNEIGRLKHALTMIGGEDADPNYIAKLIDADQLARRKAEKAREAKEEKEIERVRKLKEALVQKKKDMVKKMNKK